MDTPAPKRSKICKNPIQSFCKKSALSSESLTCFGHETESRVFISITSSYKLYLNGALLPREPIIRSFLLPLQTIDSVNLL